MTKQDKPTGSDNQDIKHRVLEIKSEIENIVKQQRHGDEDILLDELLKIDDQQLSNELELARSIGYVARILIPLKNYEKLEALFRKAILAMQENPEATENDILPLTYNLAALFDLVGNSTGRDEIFYKILQIAHNYTEIPEKATADIFSLVGSIYEQGGHPDAAAILYHQYIRYLLEVESELSPDVLPDMFVKYAGVLIGCGQVGRAEQVMETLAERDYRRRSLILSLLANAALDGDKQNDSVTESYLQQMIHLQEQAPVEEQDLELLFMTYHNLAVINLRSEKPERLNSADELMTRALKLAAEIGIQGTSRYADSLGQLALIAIEKGEFERAGNIYSECFQVYEAMPESDKNEYMRCLSDAGFLYLKLDKPAKAAECFERFRELQKDQNARPDQLANAISNCALAKFKGEDYVTATRLYNEALELRADIQH